MIPNKSPSPIPGRPSPSPRNSEIGNAMRRSFTVSPFRNPSIDDKENPKAAKLRSPMSGSKGAKHFMSPTISAASKITPRRILEERNGTLSDRKNLSFGESVAESNPDKVESSSKIGISDPSALPYDPKTNFLAPRPRFLHYKPNPRVEEGFSDGDASEEETIQADDSSKDSADEVSSVEGVNTEKKEKEEKKSSKIEAFSAPSTIAPLDSDPSAPPYDPITNFLAPRPQFLLYKPNPRVELFLRNGKEGKCLEENFIAESFSDSDASAEETIQADDSPEESVDEVSSVEDVKSEKKEQEGELVPLSSDAETEPVKIELSSKIGAFSAPSTIAPLDLDPSVSQLDNSPKADKKEQEEEEEEDELVASVPNPINKPSSPEEESLGANVPSKCRSVWRGNVMALLIVTSIVCVSISVANLQVIDHSVFDGSSNLFKQNDNSDMLAYGKATLDGVAQKLGVWYEIYASLFTDWLSSHLKERQRVESFQYYNLTELFEDRYDLNVFVPPTRGLETEIGYEYDEKTQGLEVETFVNVEEETPFSEQQVSGLVQPVRGPESEIGDEYDEKTLGVEVETFVDVEEETPFSEQQVSGFPRAELVPLVNSPSDSESVVDEVEETKPYYETEATLVSELFMPGNALSCNLEEMLETPEAKPENSSDLEVESASVLQENEVQLQGESSQPEVSSVSSEAEPAKITDASPDAKTTEEANYAGDGAEDYSAKLKTAGVALLVVLVAIGSASLVAVKNGNDKSSAVAKKLDCSPEKSKSEAKQHSSWSFSGDYCPSEMSSYYESDSYCNKKGPNDEEGARSYARSQKKKQRRESMASSSMDTSTASPSYGSFTTYEKIPTKTGYGDVEIITPVRRSSRLRTQVTTPS